MVYLLEGNFAAAEESLMHCIDIAKREQDLDAVSFLLQKLGDVCFKAGDSKRALSLYIESENAAPQSLLSTYLFAKFLVESQGDYTGAIEKCQKVVRTANENPQPETEYDFSSNRYLAMCYSLQGCCLCQLGDYQTAAQLLNRLLEIREEVVTDFAVEFCAMMIKQRECEADAREYLNHILATLNECVPPDEWDDLKNEIKQILQMK